MRLVCADTCALEHLFLCQPSEVSWLCGLAKFILPDVVFSELKGMGPRKSAAAMTTGQQALQWLQGAGVLDASDVFITREEILAIKSLQTRYKIGSGEACCIRVSEMTGSLFLSDDQRALSAGLRELGRDRTVSSIDVVAWAMRARKVDYHWVERAVLRLRRSYVAADEWLQPLLGLSQLLEQAGESE